MAATAADSPAMNTKLKDLFRAITKLGGDNRRAPTLFALGGRGYYENPTSDLLAFFMRPDGPHELGDAFLAAFLDCLPSQVASTVTLERQAVTVAREVPAGSGRIDLLVLGCDWRLVIENKIRHQQVNPFTDYERYARDLGTSRPLFAVLSPEGRCSQPGWVGISYRTYLGAVRRRLARRAEKPVPGKWLIFTEEFILHLETEQNLTPMTPEQLALVETHAVQLAQAAQLVADYRVHVQRLLKDTLDEALPEHAIKVVDEGWAYRCTSHRWKSNDMMLIYDVPTGAYSTRTYLDGKKRALITAARAHLTKLNYKEDKEGAWHYWTAPAGSSAQKATTQAVQLAKIISALIVDKS